MTPSPSSPSSSSSASRWSLPWPFVHRRSNSSRRAMLIPTLRTPEETEEGTPPREQQQQKQEDEEEEMIKERAPSPVLAAPRPRPPLPKVLIPDMEAAQEEPPYLVPSPLAHTPPPSPPSLILIHKIESAITDLEKALHYRLPKWKIHLLLAALFLAITLLVLLLIISMIYGFGMQTVHLAVTGTALALPTTLLDKQGNAPMLANVTLHNPNSFPIEIAPITVTLSYIEQMNTANTNTNTNTSSSSNGTSTTAATTPTAGATPTPSRNTGAGAEEAPSTSTTTTAAAAARPSSAHPSPPPPLPFTPTPIYEKFEVATATIESFKLHAHEKGHIVPSDFTIYNISHIKGGPAIMGQVLKGQPSFFHAVTTLHLKVKGLGFVPIRRKYRIECRVLKLWSGGKETLSDCYGEFV